VSPANERRRRLRPVLLSALVLPGLGQLVTGRPWRALLYAGTSVALLVLVVRRVVEETTRRMPRDPEALLDPTLPLRLLVEIHRANASFFFWVTVGIVVIWAASVLDAWLSTPRVPAR
jgi:hypothetical protein